MNRYDHALRKKSKIHEKTIAEVCKNLKVNIQRFKPTENDLFFVSVPRDVSKEGVENLAGALSIFDARFIIVNGDINVSKINISGVKALKIETSIKNTEKLKEIIWSDITGQYNTKKRRKNQNKNPYDTSIRANVSHKYGF